MFGQEIVEIKSGIDLDTFLESGTMPPSSIYRTMFRLLYFSLPLPFFAVCVVMIALDGILGNVDPEKLDRQTLVRIIQIRDFRQFSPELVERLTFRAEQEFGRHSPNKPVFELSSLEKKIHVYFQSHRSEQQATLENNLALLAKVRYLQWMYEYNSATRVRKAELMNNVVADMNYWQAVYSDYLRYLEAPEPSPAEVLRGFQRMIEVFKEGASPEEVVLIDSFTKDISSVLFASGVQKSVIKFFPGFQ